MKKAIVVICILLCACTAFAKTMSLQAGFSILGISLRTGYCVQF